MVRLQPPFDRRRETTPGFNLGNGGLTYHYRGQNGTWNTHYYLDHPRQIETALGQLTGRRSSHQSRGQDLPGRSWSSRDHRKPRIQQRNMQSLFRFGRRAPRCCTSRLLFFVDVR